MALKRRLISGRKYTKLWIFGTIATLGALLGFLELQGIQTGHSGDMLCGGTVPCEGSFWINVPSKVTNYIGESVNITALCFGSNLKVSLTQGLNDTGLYKADKRFRENNPNRWKNFDFAGSCLGIGNHTFLLNGTKKQWETVKWGVDGTNIDPYFLGVNEITVEKNGVGKITATFSISDSQYTTLNVTNWMSSAINLDIAYLFNGNNAYPKSFEYLAVWNETQSYVCNGDYANYTSNPKHAWCWKNTTFNTGTNSTPIFVSRATNILFDHDFDQGFAGNKTIFWNEQHINDWKPAYPDTVKTDPKALTNLGYGSNSTQIPFVDEGLDIAYLFKSVNFGVNETKAGRVYVDVGLKSGSNQGKYAILMKRSVDNLLTAITSGRFVYIDPTYNSSYGNCTTITYANMRGGIALGEVLPVNTTVSGVYPAMNDINKVKISNNSCDFVGFNQPFVAVNGTPNTISFSTNLTQTSNNLTNLSFLWAPSGAVENYISAFFSNNQTANWKAYYENNTNASSIGGSRQFTNYPTLCPASQDWSMRYHNALGEFIDVNQSFVTSSPFDTRYYMYNFPVITAGPTGGTEDMSYNGESIGTLTAPAGTTENWVQRLNGDFAINCKYSCGDTGAGDVTFNCTMAVPSHKFKNGANLRFTQTGDQWLYGVGYNTPMPGIVTTKFGDSPFTEWILNETLTFQQPAAPAPPLATKTFTDKFDYASVADPGFTGNYSNYSIGTNGDKYSAISLMNGSNALNMTITEGSPDFYRWFLDDDKGRFIDGKLRVNMTMVRHGEYLSLWFHEMTDGSLWNLFSVGTGNKIVNVDLYNHTAGCGADKYREDRCGGGYVVDHAYNESEGNRLDVQVISYNNTMKVIWNDNLYFSLVSAAPNGSTNGTIGFGVSSNQLNTPPFTVGAFDDLVIELETMPTITNTSLSTITVGSGNFSLISSDLHADTSLCMLEINNANTSMVRTPNTDIWTLLKTGITGSLPPYRFYCNSTGATNRWSNTTFSALLTFPVEITVAAPTVLILSNGTANITSSGLVGYWRFEQSNGSAATNDSSGYGNKGTLTSMSLTGTSDSGPTVNGRFGNALQFDGVDDYIDTGNNSIMTNIRGLTVGSWVKRNSIGGNQPIVAKFTNTGNQRSFSLEFESDNTITFRISEDGSAGGTGGKTTTSAFTSTTDWYNVVGTWENGVGFKVYVNGVQQAVAAGGGSVSQIFPSITTLKVGNEKNDFGNQVYFNGTIDEVMIWNRSLSADDVRMLYNNQMNYNKFTQFTNSTNTTLSINAYSNNTFLGSGGTWNGTLSAGYQQLTVNTSGDSLYNRTEFAIPLNISPVNVNLKLYINGTENDQFVEYGHPINISVNATASVPITLSIDYPGLGNVFTTTTGTFLQYIWNHVYSAIGTFNDSSYSKNITFRNNITFVQQTDVNVTNITKLSFDLYGYQDPSGNRMKNVTFWLNRTISSVKTTSSFETGMNNWSTDVRPNNLNNITRTSEWSSAGLYSIKLQQSDSLDPGYNITNMFLVVDTTEIASVKFDFNISKTKVGIGCCGGLAVYLDNFTTELFNDQNVSIEFNKNIELNYAGTHTLIFAALQVIDLGTSVVYVDNIRFNKLINSPQFTILGNIERNYSMQNEINGSNTQYNLSFPTGGTQIAYLRAFKNVSYAEFNVSGLGSSIDLDIYNTSRVMCGNYSGYDNIYIRNSTITICPFNGNTTSGWLALIAKFNATFDVYSKFIGTGNGYRNISNSDGESFDGIPGTGGGGKSGNDGAQPTGGCGAGHAFAGGKGGAGDGVQSTQCLNGSNYGTKHGWDWRMGSAGGSGLGGPPFAFFTNKQGGNGAAALFINATTANMLGNVTLNGANGQDGAARGLPDTECVAGGGGGSAGDFVVHAKDIFSNTLKVFLIGGNGGAEGFSYAGGNTCGPGGPGAGGHFKAFYQTSFINTSMVVNTSAGAVGATLDPAGPYSPVATSSDGNGLYSANSSLVYVTPPSSLISNPYIQVGTDGINLFAYSGTYTTNTTVRNLQSSINKYLVNCRFVNGICDVPVYGGSSTPGIINLNNINITTTLDSITINITTVASLLDESITKQLNISLNASYFGNGTLGISNMNFTYLGSKNYTIDARINAAQNYTGTLAINRTLAVVYSSFNLTGIFDTPDFILTGLNNTNLPAQGQINATGFYNITNLAYHGIPINITARWNQSALPSGGFNISLGINNTMYLGKNLTGTPQQIIGNLMFKNVQGLWFYFNSINLNRTAFAFFQPDLFLNVFCNRCL